MKIQINSLEALERLIGGDTEVEIELRNNIVQEFTKKHLKQIALEPVLKTVKEAVSKEVMDKVVESYKDGFQIKFRLTHGAEQILGIKADQIFNQRIVSIIHKKLNSNQNINKMDAVIDHAAERIANEYSETVLTNKLNKLVDAKIKEKLGV